MLHLHQLLESFVKSFIRLHTKQTSSEDEIPEYITVHSLIDAPIHEMTSALRERLHTLRDSPDYNLCRYLLQGIAILQPIVKTVEPMSDEILLSKNAFIIEFIVRIQKLLLTSSRHSLPIKYSVSGLETHLDIRGLLNKGWIFSSLTPTGTILSETIFPLLSLPTTAGQDILASIITAAFEDHKKDVLLASKEREIMQLRSANWQLKLQPILTFSRHRLPLLRHASNPASLSQFGLHTFHAPPAAVAASQAASTDDLYEQENSP